MLSSDDASWATGRVRWLRVEQLGTRDKIDFRLRDDQGQDLPSFRMYLDDSPATSLLSLQILRLALARHLAVAVAFDPESPSHRCYRVEIASGCRADLPSVVVEPPGKDDDSDPEVDDGPDFEPW